MVDGGKQMYSRMTNIYKAIKEEASEWQLGKILQTCVNSRTHTQNTLHLNLKRELWMSNPVGASLAEMTVLSDLDFKGAKEGRAYPP